MKVGSSARLILYCSLFWLCLASGSQAGDSAVKTEVPPDVMERVKKAAESFQKPARLTPEQVRQFQKPANAAVAAKGQEGGKDVDCDAAGGKGKTYYFFSFSQPRETIIDTIRIIKKSRDSDIVMVLRGFVGNNLKDTIREMTAIQKEVGGDAPIEVDPFAFDKYSVSEAPTIVRESDGSVGIIKGVGIKYALSKFDEKLEDYGKLGRTYPIKEEHFLEFVKRKQPQIEARLKEKMETMKKDMLVLKKYDGKFKKAEKDRVFYVDPSFTLDNDILDHEGKVLFKKGTKGNPADYVKLPRYIVIDGKDPKQVEYALKGDFRKVMIVSGNIGDLNKKYKRPFYFISDPIIERFHIERVPTIFEGEGKLVKVTEAALK